MQRLATATLSLLVAVPAAAQPFAIEQPTIAGGGGETANGNFILRGVINPQAGGRVEADGFTMTGGLFPLDREGSGCPADVNGDGTVNDSDFFAWVTAFIADPRSPAQEAACDVNRNGTCNDSDFFAWVTLFINGC